MGQVLVLLDALCNKLFGIGYCERELLWVIDLAICCVAGIGFLIRVAVDGFAARYTARVKADDVEAVEDLWIKDVLGVIGVINPGSTGAAWVYYKASYAVLFIGCLIAKQ